MAVGQWRCRRGPEERTAKAAARPASESSTLSLTASAFAAAARPVSDSSTLPFAAAAASFASPANAATFASSALANAATLATAALVSSDSMVSFTFAAALAASDRAQSIVAPSRTVRQEVCSAVLAPHHPLFLWRRLGQGAISSSCVPRGFRLANTAFLLFRVVCGSRCENDGQCAHTVVLSGNSRVEDSPPRVRRLGCLHLGCCATGLSPFEPGTQRTSETAEPLI